VAQLERWTLWMPVVFGCGCAVYFGLRHEPTGWWLYGLAALSLVAAVVARRFNLTALIIVTTFVACFASGLAIAKLRSDQVAGPIVPANLGVVTVEGWVVDVAGGGKRGAKVVLAPIWIEKLGAAQTPVRVRLVLDGPTPPPGASIRVRAILNPPPPPSAPGAYDFGRDAWFQSIGGVGLGLGEAHPAPQSDRPPLELRWMMAINVWRWNLANRIVNAIGEREGGMVTAMTTGHETWLTQDQLDSMRDSGLAHLLSISGVHMAIVGGFTFFLVRFLASCWPWLALRVSTKKVAAGAGLLAVILYLVVSGAPAPAVRSAITAGIAFVAILLDRRAITFNALAFAAGVVLITRPESIVQPGFQMSFAATAALVALAEIWPRRIREINTPWPIAAVQKIGSWVFAGLMVSLVAGMATGPFAIHHFNRTSVYGLVANALESPLSTFVTMPALAVGAALETIGLGKPFLIVAGWGVEATLAIAHFIASLPYAVIIVPSAPAFTLPISFLGVLFICLWKGRLRWLGIPFAAAVMLWPRPVAPDVWIASDGSNLAVRSGAHAVVLRPRAKVFDSELWMKRRGLTAFADPEAAADLAYDCDRSACKSRPAQGPRISGWWGKKAPPDERFAGLCAGADLVVVRAVVDRLPETCRGVMLLDARDFERGGALELWRRDGQWRGRWASDLRGDRPWTRVASRGTVDAQPGD
jgi:competence protein ComEC